MPKVKINKKNYLIADIKSIIKRITTPGPEIDEVIIEFNNGDSINAPPAAIQDIENQLNDNQKKIAKEKAKNK